LRDSPRFLLSGGINVDAVNVHEIDVELFKSIGRAPGSAAAVDGRAALRILFDERHKFPLRHV
jgi:hypothetical protein